jgi:hypothetical protein
MEFGGNKQRKESISLLRVLLKEKRAETLSALIEGFY